MRHSLCFFSMRKYLAFFMKCFLLLLVFPKVTVSAQSDLLRVGCDKAYAPYEYVEGGEVRGFNVDLIKEIAKLYDIDIVFVADDWVRTQQRLLKSDLDVLSGMFYSEDRDLMYDFSLPFITMSYRIFTSSPEIIKGLAALREPYSVAVERGSFIIEFLQNNYPNLSIVEFPTVEDVIQAVSAADVDLALMTYYQGLFLKEQFKSDNVIVVGGSVCRVDYCYAALQGNDEIVNLLQEGLSILHANGTYTKIYNKWFSNDSVDLSDVMYKWGMISLMVLLIAFLVVTVWLVILRVTVKEKTRHLSRELSERINVERALKESVSMLQAFIESIPSPIFHYDNDGILKNCNNLFAINICSSSKETIIGMSIDDLKRNFCPGLIDCVYYSLGDDNHFELSAKHPDGSSHFYVCYLSDFNDRELNVNGKVGFFHDITDLRSSEREVNWLRKIVADASAAIISIDIDGIIETWNSGAEKIYGYTAKEMLGTNISYIMHPDCYGEHSRMFEIVKNGDRIEPYRTKRITKSGDTIDIEMLLSPVNDYSGELIGMSAIIRDITEFAEFERKLIASEERFRTLVKNMRTGVAIFDVYQNGDDFVYKDVNQYVEFIEKMSRDELIGKKYTEVYPGAREFDVYRAMRTTMVTGRPQFCEISFYQLPNFSGWRKTHVYQLPTSEIVVVYEDVSDQMKIEAALRRAKETAERAFRSKSRFLANVSHEIRTPMNAVIGYSNLLDKTPLNKEQDEYIRMIKQSGTSLLVLINDILDLSRIEEGEFELNEKLFDLKTLIEGAVKIVFVDNPAKLEYSIGYAADIERYFRGDPMRLRQIILNLLGNAKKFTEKGSVSISVQRDRSGLSISKRLEKISIIVRDTGVGIAQEKIDRIFNAFTQVDETCTRQFGGTGLGLAIAKALVERMNGNIWVKSQLGLGSTFGVNISLPKASADIAFVPPAEISLDCDQVVEHEIFSELCDQTVLVVEDNPVNAKLLSAMLEKYNFDIRFAVNGLEAIDVLKEKDSDVSLIFMDLMMPLMGGVEAAEHIRTKLGLDVPIIAVSAAVQDEDKQNCLNAGMNDFLSKPIDAHDLSRIVSRYSLISG